MAGQSSCSSRRMTLQRNMRAAGWKLPRRGCWRQRRTTVSCCELARGWLSASVVGDGVQQVIVLDPAQPMPSAFD
jgi:hypothetical protein